MNVYERALAVLDEHGWGQGPDRISPCLVTSLAKATAAAAAPEDVISYLATLLPDACGTDDSFAAAWRLIQFNDDPHTTEEDVRLLLKRAAAGEIA